MERPIRLLLLTDSLNAGGAERSVLLLARFLNPAMFRLFVCALGSIGGNPLRSEFEQLGIPVTVLGSTRFYHPRSALRLAALVRRERIDLIHAQLTSADLLGRTVGRLLGVPVVSTLTNELRGYDTQPRLRRALQAITARHLATRIVPVSRTSAPDFQKHWGIPERKLHPIPNGVQMEPLLAVPEPAERPSGTPLTITTIGRLHPQKAQRVLLDAARIVLSQRQDVRFQLVGEGPLEHELKAYAQRLGLGDGVVFTGLRRDIPALLAASDIFTLSSSWEGLPLAAVEAMAAARPVVLTDVGACRELVPDTSTGIVVPPGDPAALAAAYLELLENPARRRAMGSAARARVRETYSIEAVARAYEALYAEVVGQPLAQASNTRQYVATGEERAR
jgi:glycosyltransferase involved in cell wall biosynthesis